MKILIESLRIARGQCDPDTLEQQNSDRYIKEVPAAEPAVQAEMHSPKVSSGMPERQRPG
jgi:hypothetical protein